MQRRPIALLWFSYFTSSLPIRAGRDRATSPVEYSGKTSRSELSISSGRHSNPRFGLRKLGNEGDRNRWPAFNGNRVLRHGLEPVEGFEQGNLASLGVYYKRIRFRSLI